MVVHRWPLVHLTSVRGVVAWDGPRTGKSKNILQAGHNIGGGSGGGRGVEGVGLGGRAFTEDGSEKRVWLLKIR